MRNNLSDMMCLDIYLSGLSDLEYKKVHILWVNNGFTEMTGYPKSEAINRNPDFLQGEKTSKAVILKIRNKIQQTKPFKTEIINYRKDGSVYNCEIRLFPLIGESSLHFLALERAV